uniref:Uncharacterized protein n=1 Tax=Salarias fasciatus TaxID=181472 RepID=A0A672FW32_SALFA
MVQRPLTFDQWRRFNAAVLLLVPELGRREKKFSYGGRQHEPGGLFTDFIQKLQDFSDMVINLFASQKGVDVSFFSNKVGPCRPVKGQRVWLHVTKQLQQAICGQSLKLGCNTSVVRKCVRVREKERERDRERERQRES